MIGTIIKPALFAVIGRTLQIATLNALIAGMSVGDTVSMRVNALIVIVKNGVSNRGMMMPEYIAIPSEEVDSALHSFIVARRSIEKSPFYDSGERQAALNILDVIEPEIKNCTRRLAHQQAASDRVLRGLLNYYGGYSYLETCPPEHRSTIERLQGQVERAEQAVTMNKQLVEQLKALTFGPMGYCSEPINELIQQAIAEIERLQKTEL